MFKLFCIFTLLNTNTLTNVKLYYSPKTDVTYLQCVCIKPFVVGDSYFMENRYYVYLHKTLKGKVFYVGKGCGKRAFISRNRKSHWNNTVKKHGLRVEFLHTQLTEQEAFDLEEYYITLFGRKVIGNGLLINIETRGDRNARYNCKKTYQFTKEGVFVREYASISEAADILGVCAAAIGTTLNKEHNICKGFMFATTSTINYKYSFKTKGNPVYCYDEKTGEYLKEYKSCADASRDLGIYRKLINLCCLRKQLSTNGYAFSYIKMNKFKGRPKQKHRTANKLILVEKIETGESHTFESCRAIAFILKLDRKEVGKCANGKMESYKGYKFNYINK